MSIAHPYILFLGDAPDQLAAKTANGVAMWRRSWCVGQLRLDGCNATVGLNDVTLEEGVAAGAKTLVMFCNGMWCGQSPANIRTLLRFGYPADKLKWYRGGMQDWEILGLTTVTP